MANEIILKGFKEFQDKLRRLPAEVRSQAGAYVEDSLLEWEEKAKLAAPVDQGFLRSHISSRLTGELSGEVVSPMNYSAYVEWGTGTRVSVPNELKEYALQFKGTRITVGRHPSPFFFVQKPLIERELIANLKRLMETPR